MVWIALANTIPLYPLYVLLFARSGMSSQQISALFVVWCVVGLVAEVPAGAVADRWSRRGSLAAAGLLQAAGFALWVLEPSFAGFAAGFVLWGLGGSLISGALETLIHDGLAEAGAEAEFGRVYGLVSGADLASQIPAAGAATLLVAVGGFVLVGWVSVGACLAASGLALRLPEPSRPCRPAAGAGPPTVHGESAAEPGYLATLRAGIAESLANPEVRVAVLSLAAVAGLDGLDEYWPLLARDWGVPVAAIPLAVLVIPLAAAAGAALAGRGRRLHGAGLAAGFLLLGAAGLIGRPVGLLAVSAFSFLYSRTLVALEAQLQSAIEGPARATVTSVAALGTGLSAIMLFGVWALGGLGAAVALGLVVASALICRFRG